MKTKATVSTYYVVAPSDRWKKGSPLAIHHFQAKPHGDRNLQAASRLNTFSYGSIISKCQVFSSPDEALKHYREKLAEHIQKAMRELEEEQALFASLPATAAEMPVINAHAKPRP